MTTTSGTTRYYERYYETLQGTASGATGHCGVLPEDRHYERFCETLRVVARYIVTDIPWHYKNDYVIQDRIID